MPRRCTLDGFMAEVEGNRGVDLREIEPLTTLVVHTCNSVYRIIPLVRGETRVVVQGGPFFPYPTEVEFSGSTFGGSFLKIAWIGHGLHMEMNIDGQRIITSPVCHIGVDDESQSTCAAH